MRRMFLSALLLVAGAVGAMATDYTVVCSLNGGGVSYSSNNYTNEQTISADALAASDLTATAVEGYVSQVSIAGTKVYVDYYKTNTDYLIKHSMQSNSAGWFLSYDNAGIIVKQAADHTCYWKFEQGTDANTVYIKTEDAIDNSERYIHAYVAHNTKIVYGYTPKPYHIAHIDDSKVTIMSTTVVTNPNGNYNNDHRCLNNNPGTNGDTKVVGWGNGNDNSYWTIEEVATKTINYTLTDQNGTTYEGTCTGQNISEPAIGGCTGLTYTDVSQTEENNVITYSATVNFPFPVSSGATKNWTYISGTPNDSHCHWYANTSDENIHYIGVSWPTNEANSNERYEWAVIPTLTNGAFTFVIYNNYKQEYLQVGTTVSNNTKPVSFVQDVANATSFTYGPSTVANYNAFLEASNPTWALSVETNNTSVTAQSPHLLVSRLMSSSTGHKGYHAFFETPADFAALMAQLKIAAGSPIGTGVGQYTAGNGWNADNVAAVIAEGSTTYWTAAQFNTALAAKPTLNAVPAGFYTFKSAAYNHYLTAGNTGAALTAAADKGADAIFYYTHDTSGQRGNIYTYNKGYMLEGTKVGAVNATGSAFSFPVAGETANDYGHYKLTYWAGAVKDNNGSITINSEAAGWVVEPVTALPLTVPATGYTTFSAPVPVTIPTDEVTAYTVSEVGDVVSLTEQTGTVPAQTGLIIYKENGGDVSLTIATEAGTIDGPNQLQANVKATQHATADNHYFLGTVSGKTGFYRNGADGTLTGHKAYLNAPANGGEVKAFLPFDTATGIDEVNGQQSTVNGLLFDLQGRQLPRLRKGVNIVNGKKIIVK